MVAQFARSANETREPGKSPVTTNGNNQMSKPAISDAMLSSWLRIRANLWILALSTSTFGTPPD